MGFGAKRETVFAALRAKKINYAAVPDSPQSKHMVEIAHPNGNTWIEYIPPELGRREPQRLADLFDIPVEWFYNRLLIPGEEEDKPPS